MSDQDTIIRFEHVTKSFKVSSLSHQGLKGYLLNPQHSPTKRPNTFRALSDINLEIKKGEFLGLIGPNGAGKSTLLALIAQVIYPTAGRVTVKGRIAPLLALGAGFHPYLTGRENIFINGIILGLTRREISAKIDRIIEFSGLENFIDQPTYSYSSGMYMRLGFSVAVNIDPEIMLVDEVLAVGDEQFQQKCLSKMNEFKKQGVTFIFVSHSLETVESMCDRVAYLEQGNLVYTGPPQEAIQLYQTRLSEVSRHS